MPSADAQESDVFQPGQLGLRHLLGLLTVVAMVLGFSAARLRAMTTVEAGQVAIHWLYLLIVAGGGYLIQTIWRRRVTKPAGAVMLRVLQKPVTESRRRRIRWLLTVAVILDGIFISLAVGHGKTIGEALQTPGIGTVLIQLPMMEGWLWLAWIHHWLSNPYWVEFREQGILVNRGFYPWDEISHLGWSSLRPRNLAFFCQGMIIDLPIDPASHAAVDELLEKVREVGQRPRCFLTKK